MRGIERWQKNAELKRHDVVRGTIETAYILWSLTLLHFFCFLFSLFRQFVDESRASQFCNLSFINDKH